MGVMSKKAREIFYRKGRPITHIASAPSVHDARMYERAGFEYIFLGGDATFGIMLGIPGTYMDITEKTFIAKYYVNAVNIPVLMDCDEVCGRGPAIVERAVEKYVDIGLAGMDIDDRVVFEVRGAARTEREHGISECVPVEQMADVIGAAKDVMKSLDPDFVLRVRCYDFHVGTPLEDTIKRLQAYERAGADVLYLGGVETPEDTRKCLDGLNIPCTVPATWMTYDLARDLGLVRGAPSLRARDGHALGRMGVSGRLQPTGIRRLRRPPGTVQGQPLHGPLRRPLPRSGCAGQPHRLRRREACPVAQTDGCYHNKTGGDI